MLRGAAAVARARFRARGRSALRLTFRLAAAGVASYVVALWFFPGTEPLLAPLTALLVVQLTPVSLLTSGAQRVMSVVSGVLVALGFTLLVGLTWWSLGILIAVSLLIGQAIRLGPQIPEVPISAMLVMGVGSRSAGAAAWQRVAETLVGAMVGILANLLIPPKVPHENAGLAIEGLATDVAALLHRGADGLEADPPTAPLPALASAWLDDARRITHGIPAVGAALLQAEEARRLNLRAFGTRNTGPGLRQGLEAVEHSAVVIRILFRALVDAARAGEHAGPPLDAATRTAVALLMRDLATGVREFGRLVHADADPDARADPAPLREALSEMQDARARVTDLILAGTGADLALTELLYGLLSTVERLLRELDPDERARYLTGVEQVSAARRRATRDRRAGTRNPTGMIRASTTRPASASSRAPGSAPASDGWLSAGRRPSRCAGPAAPRGCPGSPRCTRPGSCPAARPGRPGRPGCCRWPAPGRAAGGGAGSPGAAAAGPGTSAPWS